MTYVGAVPTTGDFKLLDSITTSSATTFNLRQGGVAVYPQSANHCIVQLNGINQVPGSSFNIVNDTIVFASSLSSDDVINQILVLGNVNDIGVPSSDSVGSSHIQDDSISDEHLDITAITGQTAITSLADTDKFLVSDASDSGNLKYVEKQYLPSGGLVHVASASTTSNVSTVDINGCFSATYRNYLLIFDLTPSSNGANPYIRFKDTSNNAITSNSYGYAFSGQDYSGGAENIVANNNDIYFQIGQGTTNNENTDFPASSGVLHIINPFSSANNINYLGTLNNRGNNGEIRAYSGAGRYGLQTQIAGLQFFFSSGNVNNLTAKVYGIVDS